MTTQKPDGVGTRRGYLQSAERLKSKRNDAFKIHSVVATTLENSDSLPSLLNPNNAAGTSPHSLIKPDHAALASPNIAVQARQRRDKPLNKSLQSNNSTEHLPSKSELSMEEASPVRVKQKNDTSARLSNRQSS